MEPHSNRCWEGGGGEGHNTNVSQLDAAEIQTVLRQVADKVAIIIMEGT